jgi:hypothetical protein
VLALLISCGAAAVVIADKLDARFLPNTQTKASLAEVEAAAGIRAPAGTVLLSAVHRSFAGGLDTQFAAQLRIPHTAMPQFLAESKLPTPAEGVRKVRNSDLPGSGTWKPDKAKLVSGSSDTLKDGSQRSVLFGLDNPQDATVYVVIRRG